MFAIRTQLLTGVALVATAVGFSTTAHAQLFGSRNYYYFNGPPVYAQPAYPVVSYGPAIQTASVSDCPCMKPVTETVYKDVTVIDYKPIEKVVDVPVMKTVLEDQQVTTYETVNEVKTVEVPTYVNQTVTEMRPVTQNNSYWRTLYQPIPKMHPCQYDSRPGLVGEFNRIGYAFRNSVTPNAIARREYVPNVVSYNVPVQRTVAIPTTRTVSYNVARAVPVTTVRKVPVQRTVMEKQTVTAYEPVTRTERVAIGTQTKMVYIGSDSQTTAAQPTPSSTTAGNEKGATRLQSMPSEQQIPLRTPTYRQNDEPATAPVEAQPQPTPARVPVATQPKSEPVIHVAGWQTTRQTVAKPIDRPVLEVPTLVAQQ